MDHPQPPPLDAAQTIAPAVRYAWRMLTRPFSLRKWLALGFVALMSGMFGSGGGVNFNVPSGGGRQWPGAGTQPMGAYAQAAIQWAREHVLLIAILVAVLVVFAVVLSYLTATFRFIFLDSVARNRAAIRRAFAENWDRGLALFLFNLLLTFVATAIFIAAAVMTVLPFVLIWRGGGASASGSAIVLTVMLALVDIAIWFVMVAVAVLISVTLMDFVLAVMYLEERGIWSAWGRTLGLIGSQPGAFAVYYLLKIPIGIAAGIAAGLLALAGILAGLIPVGVLVLIGYGVAVAGHAAWAWTSSTIFLTVFVGGIVLLYVVYLATCASLPVTVFRQSWALAFLGERDRRLAVLTLLH